MRIDEHVDPGFERGLEPTVRSLGPDDVHVWRATLDRAPDEIAGLEQLLSDDERARAARFRFPVHRDRFVVGRGLLRRLLGCYLGEEPRHLRFSYNAYGKPALGDVSREREIAFNLSHADHVALYALTRGRKIGVDVERLRPDVDYVTLARSIFSSGEMQTLRSLTAGEQRAGFFAAWTRKEAYIKALGDGLTHPLDQFDVSLAPGDAPALLRVRGDPAAPERWSFWEVGCQPEYAAALAVEGRDLALRELALPSAREPAPGEADQSGEPSGRTLYSDAR